MDAYLPIAAYAAGLALTLLLACYLTPARWWRRPTLRNLTIVGGGTWAIGALLLAQAAGSQGAPAVAEAQPQPPIAAAPRTEPTGHPFRAHRDLNLRDAASTSAARLATIPAGATVTPTGVRNGDWWQVQAKTNGKTLTGWASSLWLRRQAE